MKVELTDAEEAFLKAGVLLDVRKALTAEVLDQVRRDVQRDALHELYKDARQQLLTVLGSSFTETMVRAEIRKALADIRGARGTSASKSELRELIETAVQRAVAPAAEELTAGLKDLLAEVLYQKLTQPDEKKESP